MAALFVRPLDGATWSDFARLVERHDGVWGGCWCNGLEQRRGRAHEDLGAEAGRPHAATNLQLAALLLEVVV